MPQHSPTPASWLCQFPSDRFLRGCGVVALLLIFMPPDGIPGLDLCWFKHLTGAPCPGCGMTRCGSSMLHGELKRAANYHPFGLVVIPLIIVGGLVGVAPSRWREATRKILSSWDR